MQCYKSARLLGQNGSFDWTDGGGNNGTFVAYFTLLFLPTPTESDGRRGLRIYLQVHLHARNSLQQV